MSKTAKAEESLLSHSMSERRDFSLAAMTSWHIGGPAEILIQPADSVGLSHYLKSLPQGTPVTWLGLGSNMLVRDQGVEGVVICTRSLTTLALQEDGSIYADAGVTCAKFARFCCKHGFEDGAFFAGIPGTIGGALAMNAGAFGGETWEWVEGLRVITQKGDILQREKNEYAIAYRTVSKQNSTANDLDKEAFLGAFFRFPQKLSMDGLEKIKVLLRQRAQTQPIGTLNCGSVYRNPDKEFAARLIESCGLKGFKIGGAAVSEKHANFIINQDNASSNDIEQLMIEVEKTVYLKYQIKLEKEVKIIGKSDLFGKTRSV